MLPENEIIAFYLSERGSKDINTQIPTDRPLEKMLMVANLRHGSVDSIMQMYPHRFLQYNYPQHITTIDSTEIYILNSIYETGLKPGSFLEKYVDAFFEKKEFRTEEMQNIGVAIKCLYHLRRLGSIDSLLNRMLELDPGNEFALESLGNLKLSTGMNDIAEDYFRKLIAVNPGHVAALCWVGVMESRRENFEPAEKYLLSAIRQDSTDFSSLYNLGLVYLKTGDILNAIPWLEKALIYRPEDVNAILGLGMAYSSSPELREKALELFRTAQELNPLNRETIEKQLIEPLLSE